MILTENERYILAEFTDEFDLEFPLLLSQVKYDFKSQCKNELEARELICNSVKSLLSKKLIQIVLSSYQKNDKQELIKIKEEIIPESQIEELLKTTQIWEDNFSVYTRYEISTTPQGDEYIDRYLLNINYKGRSSSALFYLLMTGSDSVEEKLVKHELKIRGYPSFLLSFLIYLGGIGLVWFSFDWPDDFDLKDVLAGYGFHSFFAGGFFFLISLISFLINLLFHQIIIIPWTLIFLSAGFFILGLGLLVPTFLKRKR